MYLVSPLMENRTMGSVFSRGAWDEDGNYYEIWQFGSSYGYWDETAQERVGEDRWYTEDFPWRTGGRHGLSGPLLQPDGRR